MLDVPGGGLARQVLVYRPPVPESATLPVVYYLHGLPGQAKDALTGQLVSQAAALARAGHPFVLAAPDGNGVRGDPEWADSLDGRDLLESYLLKRVIPLVEGRHLRASQYRTLLGFSMGGYGAANIGLRHPDVFGSWAAVSGYFHIDDPDDVFGHDPAYLAANSPDQNGSAARGHRVLLVEGRSDPSRLVRGEASRMATILRAVGAQVSLRLVPGGHEVRLVREAMPLVATWLLPPYRPAVAAATSAPMASSSACARAASVTPSTTSR